MRVSERTSNCGGVCVGWWMSYWVRTATSPTNYISLLATALAVLSLFLGSSISLRIAVTVQRCVAAKKPRVWVGEWVVSGCVQHQQHVLVKPCSSAQKSCIAVFVWVVCTGGGCSINTSIGVNCKQQQVQKIINKKKAYDTTLHQHLFCF